jgi:hypothetical protein
MQTLVREPITVSKPVPRESNELAARAAKVLSYDRMAKEEKTASESAVILDWLSEHGIDPFQEKTLRKYMRRRMFMETIKLAVRTPSFIFGFLFLALSATFLRVACAGITTASGGEALAISIFTAITGSTFIAFFIVEHTLRWDMDTIASYRRPIPEFALQTAVDIRDAHPDAELLICELAENRTVRDPFLVLRLPDGRDLYLEVWNEPGFKRAREV